MSTSPHKMKIFTNKMPGSSESFTKTIEDNTKKYSEKILDYDYIAVDLYVFPDSKSFGGYQNIRTAKLNQQKGMRMIDLGSEMTVVRAMSSLDNGIPELFVNEEIMGGYSDKRREAVIGHEIGHIKDWYTRGTLTSYALPGDPSVNLMKTCFKRLSNQTILDLTALAYNASEEFVAVTYALDAGCIDGIVEDELLLCRELTAFQQTLAEESLLSVEKSEKEDYRLGIELQWQLAVRELMPLGRLAAMKMHPKVSDSITPVIDSFHKKFESAPLHEKSPLLDILEQTINKPDCYKTRESIVEIFVDALNRRIASLDE